MRRTKTEVLHFKDDKSDKVYIVEVLEENNTFYVYANYGKRTLENLIRQLKLVTEDKYAADRQFDSLVKKKTTEGYKMLGNGTRIDIPGFKALLQQGNNAMVYKHEPTEAVVEHRRMKI